MRVFPLQTFGVAKDDHGKNTGLMFCMFIQ